MEAEGERAGERAQAYRQDAEQDPDQLRDGAQEREEYARPGIGGGEQGAKGRAWPVGIAGSIEHHRPGRGKREKRPEDNPEAGSGDGDGDSLPERLENSAQEIDIEVGWEELGGEPLQVRERSGASPVEEARRPERDRYRREDQGARDAREGPHER